MLHYIKVQFGSGGVPRPIISVCFRQSLCSLSKYSVSRSNLGRGTVRVFLQISLVLCINVQGLQGYCDDPELKGIIPPGPGLDQNKTFDKRQDECGPECVNLLLC